MSATVHAYGTMPRTVRDWDAALRDVSSGEDSDAGDSLNVLQVQKNAKRVAELVHTMVPGMAVDHLMGRTPMGMNRPDAIRNDLSRQCGGWTNRHARSVHPPVGGTTTRGRGGSDDSGGRGPEQLHGMIFG